jgi:nifR3 family TIM-barrel protein
VDAVYLSELNRDVPLAAEGEFKPLVLGALSVYPPVVLAPMAGVTNHPFRTLVRRFGSGLYVSEMVTARPLAEGRERTRRIADFGPEETIRSLQLYGVDPYFVGEAVKWLVGEGHVDHIDMNFGCPVPKVTRKGGGSAIPLKPRLLRNIVRAAVQNAGHVPVTIKFRKGIDAEHLTFLEAGRIGEGEGVRAVALHARTAAELYDGHADWGAIAELKNAVRSIPVLGNGDIWEAHDALRMMRTTGCDGVVVGRGCLGRPWLFRDLNDVFAGRSPQNPPNLGQVFDIMFEHARMLCDWLGEPAAMRMFRKHATWYTKGFRGSAQLRERLVHTTALADLHAVFSLADRDTAFPPLAMRVPRGKTSGRQRVQLPEGYLDQLDDDTPPTDEVCEVDETGGG